MRPTVQLSSESRTWEEFKNVAVLQAMDSDTLARLGEALEAGDYFGEMALLDQKSRSASAVAMGDARFLGLIMISK